MALATHKGVNASNRYLILNPPPGIDPMKTSPPPQIMLNSQVSKAALLDRGEAINVQPTACSEKMTPLGGTSRTRVVGVASTSSDSRETRLQDRHSAVFVKIWREPWAKVAAQWGHAGGGLSSSLIISSATLSIVEQLHGRKSWGQSTRGG